MGVKEHADGFEFTIKNDLLQRSLIPFEAIQCTRSDKGIIRFTCDLANAINTFKLKNKNFERMFNKIADNCDICEVGQVQKPRRVQPRWIQIPKPELVPESVGETITVVEYHRHHRNVIDGGAPLPPTKVMPPPLAPRPPTIEIIHYGDEVVEVCH